VIIRVAIVALAVWLALLALAALALVSWIGGSTIALLRARRREARRQLLHSTFDPVQPLRRPAKTPAGGGEQ
jgi:hypothetical protein